MALTELYDMIFKRKSFRRFNDTLTLSEEELQDIRQKIDNLIPLADGIKAGCKIAPREVKSILLGKKAPFYNSIDMGIFLCFLELSLYRNGFSFGRTLGTGDNNSGLIPVASYSYFSGNSLSS
ncbi:hypothetical protein MASR2M70_18940 [Bacillota bacterium]